MVKRLHRSNQNRIIGGVCGGMAEYFAVDPTLVRLAWILSAFLDGIGLLGYVVAWVIIPPRPEGEASAQWYAPLPPSPPGGPLPGGTVPGGTEGAPGIHGARALGIILVILGGVLLIRNFAPRWSWGPMWPVILVLLGAWIMFDAVRGRR